MYSPHVRWNYTAVSATTPACQSARSYMLLVYGVAVSTGGFVACSCMCCIRLLRIPTQIIGESRDIQNNQYLRVFLSQFCYFILLFWVLVLST